MTAAVKQRELPASSCPRAPAPWWPAYRRACRIQRRPRQSDRVYLMSFSTRAVSRPENARSVAVVVRARVRSRRRRPRRADRSAARRPHDRGLGPARADGRRATRAAAPLGRCRRRRRGRRGRAGGGRVRRSRAGLTLVGLPLGRHPDRRRRRRRRGCRAKRARWEKLQRVQSCPGVACQPWDGTLGVAPHGTRPTGCSKCRREPIDARSPPRSGAVVGGINTGARGARFVQQTLSGAGACRRSPAVATPRVADPGSEHRSDRWGARFKIAARRWFAATRPGRTGGAFGRRTRSGDG